MDLATQQSSPHTEEAVQTTQGGNSEEQQFTGLLNGSGLLAMDDQDRGLIVSVTTGGGWDSNPGSSSDSASSSVYSLSPYIAIHGASPKSQFIVQYQPTILGYPSGMYAGQTLHAASAQANGNLSDRLEWKMNLNGSYGQNGARFLAPLQSVPVGEVPGTGASNASYLPNSGSITYILGSAETSYRRSERGTVSFDLWSSFNRVTGFDQAGGAATARLSYRHDLSPTLALMTYAQGSHYYGDLKCEGLGAGAGIRWRMGESTTFTADVGPQITRGCGEQQGYSYTIGYSTRISSRTQFYLLTNRLPMVSYLGPGLWQRGASAGLQQQVTRVGLISVDIGYSSSTALTAVNSYRGIAFSAIYGVRLGHGLGLSYSYRGLFTDSAGTGYNRSLAQISLTWTSNSGKVFQNR